MYYTNAKDLYRSPLPKSRFKGSSLPQYGWGAVAKQFATSQYGQDMVGKLAPQLGQLGTMLGAADAVDGQMNPYLSTGAGALKGAQLGAKLGSVVPGVGNVVGAGVGALIGGGAALLKARKEEDLREEAELQKQKEEEYRKESLRVANLQTDKGILDTYPTSGVTNAGFMMAAGGVTDPPVKGPAIDPALLAGLPPELRNNSLSVNNMPERDVLTGYSDAELAVNRTKGQAIAFQNRAEILGENLEEAGQYIADHPLDAAQVGLGVIAIGADGIPIVGNAVSAGADLVNAGISGGRSIYYANKGDAGNAAFYGGLAAMDLAAAAPGVGNIAGASKVGTLLNKTIHATGEIGHNVMHAAHTGSQVATTYKGGKLGKGAVDAMSAETPAVAPMVTESRVYAPTAPSFSEAMYTPRTSLFGNDSTAVSNIRNASLTLAYGGKIPTEAADYLAEGGEVIKHAPNDFPATDQNGGARALNSNTSLFTGDSHNAPSQGVGVANNQEARIYSKRLYAPKSLVAKLKSL